MTKQTILLCAATRFEARACQAAVDRIPLPPGLSFEVLLTGIGPESASRQLTQRLALASRRPSLIVSTGFAGALQLHPPIGTWALADHISKPGHSPISIPLHFEETLRRTSLSWIRAGFLSTRHVVTDLNREQLRPPTEALVDMESFALCEIAFRSQIAFQALRMITDTADEPIPRFIANWATGCRSMSQLVREPIQVLSFLARARRYPGWLAAGWRQIATCWAH